MNELYFVCPECKVYVDAGYRWCYWELEHPGIVRQGEYVDVDRVLNHKPYWNPPKNEGSAWLYNEVFPSVRDFFDQHRSHGIVFWEDNHFPDDQFLNWLQLGHAPYPSPRYLAEVLRLTHWDEVLAWDAQQEFGWLPTRNKEREQEIRQAFEHYVQRRG